MSHDALLAKQWRYDAAGDVIQKGDQRYGVTSYRYDPTGRIEQAMGPGLPSEVFRWDAAANLVSSDHPGGYVEHNRLKMFEDKRFEYDDWHQLRTVVTKDRNLQSTTHFEYDAFGRRIRKLNGGYASTDFLWDGMRLVEETYHGRQGKEALTFLYEPDSYVPLARIDHVVSAANDEQARDKVYYFHNDVSGLPEEMTDAEGELIWQARYKVWGNAVQEEWIRRAPAPPPPPPLPPVPRPQNLRYQGQYLDRETGLHYNTFRYYDPDIGRFINQDPIGLLGGHNLYRYAPNPATWIDPLGWAPRVPSVDFSNNGLYQAGEGQNAIVKIKMQGYRALDDTQAFNASKIPRDLAGDYTWHHMSDFNPESGEVTMQLVKRNVHRSIAHDGGVSQYQQYSGTKYDTPAARDFATEKGWRAKARSKVCG